MKRPAGHANVEEHPKGSGKYRVRQRIGKSLKTLASGLTEVAANEMANAIGTLRHTQAAREGITLEQFVEGFLGRRQLKGVRGVAKDAVRMRKHVSRSPIGKLAVATLVRRDVVEWRDALKGSYRSRVRNLNLLKVCLDDAVERELLQANPAREVKIHRSAAASAKDDLEGILTPAEQQALIAAVPLRWRGLVVFALLTGLRQAEQWWLMWDSVADDCSSVIVRRSVGGLPPKSGKIREVPLLPAARAALEAQRKRGQFVFPGGRGARRQDGKAPLLWPQWVKAAGIERKIRWHDLRHTCATSLLAGWWGRTWTLVEVCQLLGHSSVTVTERYARKLNETLRFAVSQSPDFKFPLGNAEEPNMLNAQGKASQTSAFVKHRSQVQIQQSAPALSAGGGEHGGNKAQGDAEFASAQAAGWFGPLPPPAVAGEFGLAGVWGGR